MTRWRVFEPAGAEAPSEDALLVRDRFGWIAFLLPVVWLLRYRLFLMALAVLVVSLGLPLLLRGTAAQWTAPILPLLVGLVVALEGPDWRARRLARRGWREVQAVVADGRQDAEAIYFAGKLATGTIRLDAGFAGQPASRPGSSPLRPGRTLFDTQGA